MGLVCCGVTLMDCFDFCLLLFVFMLVFFFDDVRTYHHGVIQTSVTFNVQLEADIQICAALNVPRVALHSTPMMLSKFQLVLYIQENATSADAISMSVVGMNNEYIMFVLFIVLRNLVQFHMCEISRIAIDCPKIARISPYVCIWEPHG
jgi:hypothetical protein